MYGWRWEEAFDKFGFNDGDGQVETWQVEAVLRKAGYVVEVNQLSLHNTIISSVKEQTEELLPKEDSDFCVGYDDPRDYLPRKIIELLDDKLSRK